MASLICPNCGKDNPDFLDDCQFCQTPLRREATLNIGEEPTKRSTGELEGVLPDWLKEARQQARDSAEEEAAKEATRPKIQKVEPPDLLAGLAFQAASDEEEIPDWLAAINPIKEDKVAPEISAPADAEQPSDFFAQFEQPTTSSVDVSPTMPMSGELQQEAGLPWSPDAGPTQKDELTDWLSQPSGQQVEGQIDWMADLNAPASREPAAPEQPEDLSWLHDLEASTKEPPATPATPQADTGWMSNLDASSGSQEDLSWLNNLGGVPTPPAQPESQAGDLGWLSNLGGTPLEEPASPATASTSSQDEDLSWLNNVGGLPSTPPSVPSQPSSAEEDLGWLSNLGGTPAPTESTSAQEDLGWLDSFGSKPVEPDSAQPAPEQEDLGWLNNSGGTLVPTEPAPVKEDQDWLSDLGSTPSIELVSPGDDLGWLNKSGETSAAAELPAVSQEDLNWLDNLGGIPEAPPDESAPATSLGQPDVPDWLKTIESQQAPESTELPQLSPRRTAPLSEEAMREMPDWLRSATEESTSMPPLGAASMDWFASKEQAADELKFDEGQRQPAGEEAFDQVQGISAPSEQDLLSTPADSASLANQDVDALFAVDMPDWLSQPETAAEETASVPASDDALAPVNLPSWVQAMRPVEAAISEATAVSADQTTEREGPLAGFRGLIPLAPIGSAQRPKAVSLKLQASAEQQAGASLLEQIIAGEAAPQPLKASTLVLSQRALRWTLAGLFLVVLGAVIALGSQFMPISAALPVEVSNASNVVVTLPENAPVLIVMDYEPSLAGEMEAATGPLLDQLAVLRKPILTFIATSPNGTGLVERLLVNTRINKPAPEGQDYQSGSQYFNAGYLPGGLAGVRGFIESPQTVLPSVNSNQFSEFAAVIVITDQAESGQMWIEQLTLAKQSNSALASQQLLVVASAQAGPMLQPYVSSRQLAGMISGIPDAARYEFVNNSRPGAVRSYWDAFGVGLMMAIVAIVLGSLWNVLNGIRSRRAESEQG